MDFAFTRRRFFEGSAIAGSVAAAMTTPNTSAARPLDRLRQQAGWVIGHLTGAQATAETLKQEGVGCVFGIPGAQENELWDEFKARGVPYLLVAHEFAASCMADGYARSTGRPGVLCVVPGPGVTNALTGLGEALLDSSPVVAIVGDVAGGNDYRPFQVHSLPQADLLRPVTKCVLEVQQVSQIPSAIRQALTVAVEGEPGPAAVVIPYNLFIEKSQVHSPPSAPPAVPFDESAFEAAVALLNNPKLRVGIYAGYGCMDHGPALTAVAELLQAPVATSVSGKGCISECHPLAVGWGYGPHASRVAERAFRRDRLHPLNSGVDCLLAIGVKFSEVSTGFYGNPRPKWVIHVDANRCNLGRVMPADVAVHADAGLFLNRLLAHGDSLRRPADARLLAVIAAARQEQERELTSIPARPCGIDPLAVIAALRRHLPDSAVLLTDVTVSEHLAAEYYRVTLPRSYFNPVDNQSMGWSIPAAIGVQRAWPGRVVASLTGDGCLLMAAQELSTAARESLPVKIFVLDDRAYHYMQLLQRPAYRRTTATRLAAIDYAALARAYGVGYLEARQPAELSAVVCAAIEQPRPVLVRIATDYGDRKIRWIEAVRDRFIDELSAAQKARFLARIGARSLKPQVND